MKITSLNSKYHQKSRLFLYPNLGIRRGVSVTPIETYMHWDGMYSLEDRRLINVYHLRDDSEFKTFEKLKLLGNKLFETFVPLEDGTGAYVFDFNKHGDDFDNVAKGKYSQLSPSMKIVIKNFFGNNNGHAAYIESYLYPKKFFTMYAELLGVQESMLRTVGELCAIPDLEKEKLMASPKLLNFNVNMVNSPQNQ